MGAVARVHDMQGFMTIAKCIHWDSLSRYSGLMHNPLSQTPRRVAVASRYVVRTMSSGASLFAFDGHIFVECRRASSRSREQRGLCL